MRSENNPIFKWSSKAQDLGLCNKFNNPKFMSFVKEVLEEMNRNIHLISKQRRKILSDESN